MIQRLPNWADIYFLKCIFKRQRCYTFSRCLLFSGICNLPQSATEGEIRLPRRTPRIKTFRELLRAKRTINMLLWSLINYSKRSISKSKKISKNQHPLYIFYVPRSEFIIWKCVLISCHDNPKFHFSHRKLRLREVKVQFPRSHN